MERYVLQKRRLITHYTALYPRRQHYIYVYNIYIYIYIFVCQWQLCGLMVRVPCYISRGPGSIPGTTMLPCSMLFHAIKGESPHTHTHTYIYDRIIIIIIIPWIVYVCYTLLVRCNLEYALVVWIYITSTDANELEGIQQRFASGCLYSPPPLSLRVNFFREFKFAFLKKKET
jgi:hypothetical protein